MENPGQVIEVDGGANGEPLCITIHNHIHQRQERETGVGNALLILNQIIAVQSNILRGDESHLQTGLEDDVKADLTNSLRSAVARMTNILDNDSIWG